MTMNHTTTSTEPFACIHDFEQIYEADVCFPFALPPGSLSLSRQLVDNRESSSPGEPAGKRYVNASAPTPRDQPWQQQQQHPPTQFALGTNSPGAASARGLHAAHHCPLVPINSQKERTYHSLPPGLGRSGGKEVRGQSKLPPPQQARRWIATPADGAKADLSRLEKAQTPSLLRQRAGNLRGLSGSASMGAVTSSNNNLVGVAGRGRVVMSPRVESTVQRLSAVEECLRNLEDSMKELQSGETPLETVKANVRPAEQKYRRTTLGHA